ncbi:MAG: hypothetical protein LBC38_05110 [Oscillospiraceae bacterium]|jgi:acyl-ACP thioesterase|nr:hypothetical protein [Oscillospiraceae bacterium]
MIIEYKEVVTASRTGGDGKLTRIAALDMVQDCDCIGADSDERLSRFLTENNMAMFIVSRNAKFLNLPRYRDSLTMRTMPYVSSVQFGHRYTELRSGGELCAYSHIIAVYVNLETGRPARIPRTIADGIEVHSPPAAPSGERRIIMNRSGEPEPRALSIFRRDIDINNHVNNVRYIEKAAELLPENFDVRSIRAEHKLPAKLGDSLTAELFGGDSVQFVTLSDGNGKIFTLLEFKTYI